MKRIIKSIIHRLICIYCGCDIDASGMDNMSDTPGKPVCEDCY